MLAQPGTVGLHQQASQTTRSIAPAQRHKLGHEVLARINSHAQASSTAAPSITARRSAAISRTTKRRAPAAPLRAASATTDQQLSAFEAISQGTDRKYILVSGKGGVGKTSLSASLAVRLASEGHTTLVVSTDPAHSLGDSLAQDLSGGKPMPLEGTDLPLWGMEIDPEEAKAELKAFNDNSNASGQAMDMMRGMGLGLLADQLADLKLGELLSTPPPGLDEAAALAKVVQFAQSADYARFSRIVIDTAPTGHTLRLLALPDFVDGALGKIIRLRKKLSGATAAVRGLFGAGEEQDEVVAALEKLQERIRLVQQLFRDPKQTELVIATIPTVLGISESSRLLSALRTAGIPCHRIVVNQLLSEAQGDTFIKARLREQQAALDVVAGDPALQQLRQIRAPLVDLEVRGVPALTYFGATVWQQDVFEDMNTAAGPDKRKFFMLGGKGGVGKTSSAASLAVKFATLGEATLVVSTDPAHSLSDAFEQDLKGGLPVPVSSPMGDIPLWGMELDLEQARAEMRAINDGGGAEELNKFLDGLGLGMISSQLRDLNLGELLDTPPPGVDEAVAVSKVVQFLRDPAYSHFTRIVFDTAPTGHTLRLLSLPEFLDKSIGKIVRLKQKLSAASDAVKSFFTGKAEQDPSVVKLEALQARMEEARQLFRNPESTEFVIVTIPTIMAVSESSRLASSLRQEGVPLRTIVINQVVADNATQQLLKMRRQDQQRAMQRLAEDPGLSQLQLVQGPLLDLEVRGLPALQYFGSVVWK